MKRTLLACGLLAFFSLVSGCDLIFQAVNDDRAAARDKAGQNADEATARQMERSTKFEAAYKADMARAEAAKGKTPADAKEHSVAISQCAGTGVAEAHYSDGGKISVQCNARAEVRTVRGEADIPGDARDVVVVEEGGSSSADVSYEYVVLGVVAAVLLSTDSGTSGTN